MAFTTAAASIGIRYVAIPHGRLPVLWAERGGHHLTSVLLHLANSVLLLLLCAG